VNPNHQIEHDHVAIRAMLSRWAADDTSWDQPPLLFALLHDPDAGYGIAPVRPLNTFLHEHMGNGHRLHAVLRQIVEHVFTIEREIPGLDTLRNTVPLCYGDDEYRREWFPKVSERTVACGLVVRSEVWKLEKKVGDPHPEGSFADVPGRIESLSWQAVVDDDTFDLVWWDRGEAAPEFQHWSFDSDFYRSTKDKQRIATLMRKIVRLSARVSHQPWPQFPEAFPDASGPGPFGRF
jgi:hypothetical protein